MLRTHTCGDLNQKNIGQTVVLCGWVQKSRDLGGMTFIDIRDRYGITQLVFNLGENQVLGEEARKLGREFVIKISGKVIERSSKNEKIATGDIEIKVDTLEILNASKTTPFIIDDQTDGGEELRARYRYLDLRRNPIRRNLEFRHRMMQETRKYLEALNFIEVETPVLIKSTPEGARDFVVPSRMNPGEFYALPQSPQTFKQLLMVSGFDRYFQLVKCFRDEDLRSDRQPEFTQIDCEMSFITQEDVLETFEGLIKHLFLAIKGVPFEQFPRMSYDHAMQYYGCDKPDIRFEMRFMELNALMKNKGFPVFDQSELILGICAKNCAHYTRKEIDELTDFVKRPQIGASGLVYIRHQETGEFKSSVDKFFGSEDLKNIGSTMGSNPGDLILILSGTKQKTQRALSELRLEMGNRLGLRNKDTFAPLWVLDFPLLEWDEELGRYHAMHHPFTSPKPEDIPLLDSDPGAVRANAYDLVLNGTEIGGGSIRIHDRDIQKLMFTHLGFSEKEAQDQFGFLLDAFEYGAPPHGGIAFGFDRLCSLFLGLDSIRDVIAFPKNNAGRDVMIDSPSQISKDQLKELKIQVEVPVKS